MASLVQSCSTGDEMTSIKAILLYDFFLKVIFSLTCHLFHVRICVLDMSTAFKLLRQCESAEKLLYLTSL